MLLYVVVDKLPLHYARIKNTESHFVVAVLFRAESEYNVDRYHFITNNPKKIKDINPAKPYVVESDVFFPALDYVDYLLHIEPHRLAQAEPIDGWYVVMYSPGKLAEIIEALEYARRRDLRLVIELDKRGEDYRDYETLYNIVSVYKDAYNLEVKVSDVGYRNYINFKNNVYEIESEYPRPPVQATFIGNRNSFTLWGCFHGFLFRNTPEESMEIRPFFSYIQCPGWIKPEADPFLNLLKKTILKF